MTFWLTGLKLIPVSPIKASVVPLPLVLSGISVTLNQVQRAFSATYPVPLVSIAQTNGCDDPLSTAPECYVTAITVQIPFELVVDPFTSPPSTTLVVSQDGSPSRGFFVGTADDSVHVLTNCGIDYYFGTCVTHADGSVVTSLSPAKPGEVVTIYATGLGATSPAVGTGQATPTPAPTVSGINVNLDFHPNAGAVRPALLTSNPPGVLGSSPAFAGLTPGQVGLYQINVQLPASFPAVQACGGGGFYPVLSNLTVDIGTRYFSYDAAPICVQPQ